MKIISNPFEWFLVIDYLKFANFFQPRIFFAYESLSLTNYFKNSDLLYQRNFLIEHKYIFFLTNILIINIFDIRQSGRWRNAFEGEGP